MLTERGLDWVLNGVGATIMVVGGIVVLWALFADRSRGRKRCPKCWYDLSASPGMQCSECGFVARTERKLRKTRRHWRRCFIGVFIIAVGLAGPAYRVYRDDWRRFVPTTALIYLMPDLEARHADLYDSLEQRMSDGKLTGWQWEWLLDRCLDQDNLPVYVNIETRPRWPEGVDVYFKVTQGKRMTGIQWLDYCSAHCNVVPRGTGANDRPISQEAFEVTSTRLLPSRAQSTFAKIPESLADAGVVQLDIELSVRCASIRNFWILMNQQAGGAAPQSAVRAGSIVMAPLAPPPAELPVLMRTIARDVPIVRGGSLHDVIKPIRHPQIEAQLRESVRVRLTYDGLYCFLPPESVDGVGDVAFGLVFELLRDDVVLSTGNLLIDAGHWPGGSLRVDMAPLPAINEIQESDAVWTVRIRGDGGIALLDFDATKYWDGEFTLPMHWEDSAPGRPLWAD